MREIILRMSIMGRCFDQGLIFKIVFSRLKKRETDFHYLG